MRSSTFLDIMFTGALLVLAFVGTIGAAEEEPQAIKEAMPTAVGTTWRYLWYDARRDECDEGFSVLRIVSEQVVNGRRKWKSEFDIEPVSSARMLLLEALTKMGYGPADRGEPERYVNYYDVVREAYIMLPVDAQDQPLSDPIARFPYPVKKGQTLQLRKGTKSNIVDLKRKVKVEAGEFECIVLETREAEEEVEEAWLHVDYYSVGVGLIRGELYDLRSEKPELAGKLDLIQFQQPKDR